MALRHLPPTTAAAEISAHLAEHGYAIVDDLADNDVLDRLAHESAPFIDAASVGDDDYDGVHTSRTGALIARSPASRELVMNPLVVDTVNAFLSHATTVQLLLTQIITIGPGETQQKLHRDQMMFDLYPFRADYHVQCNTMWALTDFTRDNGATHVCPGTSTMTDDDANKIASIQAEMTRGSVLFYDGKVLHGGGTNSSSDARQGVNITYGVGWVRQEENQYLACPPDVARTLDDDLLAMMGYRQGAFSLGYVGDQQDPLAVLRGRNEKASRITDFVDRNSELQTYTDTQSPA